MSFTSAKERGTSASIQDQSGYDCSLEKPWQREVLDLLSTEPDGHKICWYWNDRDASVPGKTVLANHIESFGDAHRSDHTKCGILGGLQNV